MYSIGNYCCLPFSSEEIHFFRLTIFPQVKLTWFNLNCIGSWQLILRVEVIDKYICHYICYYFCPYCIFFLNKYVELKYVLHEFRFSVPVTLHYDWVSIPEFYVR